MNAQIFRLAGTFYVVEAVAHFILSSKIRVDHNISNSYLLHVLSILIKIIVRFRKTMFLCLIQIKLANNYMKIDAAYINNRYIQREIIIRLLTVILITISATEYKHHWLFFLK